MTMTPYTQAAEVAIRDHATEAVHRLAEWASSADAAYSVAERLVQSSFVPAAFKGKPVEATAAILAGLEIGLRPMAALRSFDVIQGQAAPRAVTLRAVVQSYGHELVLKESTATRAVVAGRRAGTETWQTSTWTIDRARELGLTGKDNWKKQPGAMLVARATAECARLIASDAILGIPYSIEEIADGAAASPVDTPVEPVEQPKRRTLSRKAKPTEEPVEEPEAAPADAITAAQSKKMHALLRELGREDRDDKLKLATFVTNREVTSTSDLTKSEAALVIDWLEARVADQHVDAESGEVHDAEIVTEES